MAQMDPFQREVATSDEVCLIKPKCRPSVPACLHLTVSHTTILVFINFQAACNSD